MQRMVGFIFVALLVAACGSETPPATPSFIVFEHQYGEQYKFLNLLIEHAHDDTWHIPYASTVQKDFSPAITIALQTWLQPLRDLQLSRAIVDDFEFYHYAVDDFNTGNVPWDDVLFRMVFEAGNNGDNVKGKYQGTWVPADMLPPLLSAEELPTLTIYDAGNTAEELTTDSRFMFILVHEMGHAFGLADTYAASGNGISGRQGNQPAAVMAASRGVLKYPPILPHGTSIELTTDDIKGLLWLYKKHVTQEIDSLSDCHFADYKYEDKPAGCVPGTPTEPQPQPQPPTTEPPTTEPPTEPPPPTEPDPPPPVINDIAAQCCDAGFSCAAWPGKADIFLCSAAQEDETVLSSPSPCCQTSAYECEAWPGRAVAALCFGL